MSAISDTGFSRWSDSLIWVLLVLLIGLSSTVALFLFFVQADEQRVSEHLERGMGRLVALATQPYLEPAVLEVGNVMNGLQSAVHEGRPLNQELLDAFLWDEPPVGFDTTTLEYLTRVAPGIRDPYSVGLMTPETVSFPIVEPDGQGLRRASGRNEYFPSLLEAYPVERKAPLGLDRTNDPMYRLALLQARDSGILTVYSSFATVGNEEEQVSHYFLPVYEGGRTPDTVEQRRRLLRGIFAMVSYISAEDAYALTTDEIQGINAVYFPDSRALYTDPEYADIQALLANGRMVELHYFMQGIAFTGLGMASDALYGVLATNLRWWALATGLLITAWLSGTLFWLRQQARRVKSLIVTRTRDLEAQTRALAETNNALRESEARYRMLADNASDVIYTCDFDGIYTYVSPAVRQQRGFDPEDFIGRPILNNLHPDSVGGLRDKLEQARSLVAQQPDIAPEYLEESLEFQSRCKDGSLKWLETTVTLLYDDDRRATGILGVTRDISERKQAEKERESLEAAVRQSQKMEAVGTLAGGIAHDFNNLLTGIFGYADILKSQIVSNPEALQSIAIIEKAATRARDLTSQLLGFARKGRFQSIPVNLNDMINEVCSLLRSSVDKRIAIIQNLSTKPPLTIGDPGQLSHMLLNLGINARDAMPKGGSLSFRVDIVELNEEFCRLHQELKAGPYIRVSVADTGIGISKEKQARIFEPFYTDKEQGKGTGLGLAMVYGVAKGHSGTVMVESEPGLGATFHIYLPFCEGGQVRSASEKPHQLIKGSGTILVIDDEEIIRNLAQNMLRSLGYEVLLAEDGVQGVALYRERQAEIDLCIVDMIMPNMGGSETTAALKAIDEGVKVILATGYSRETLGENISKAGIIGFLQKPYRKQQLSSLVAEALGNS